MQPSPARHQILWSNTLKSGVLKVAAAIFSEIAMPTAFATPCPSGPLVASTPTVSPNSGCPGVFEPFWRKFLMSSTESSYPEMCSHEYRKHAPCPAASTNLSRLSHEGFLGSILSISPKKHRADFRCSRAADPSARRASVDCVYCESARFVCGFLEYFVVVCHDSCLLLGFYKIVPTVYRFFSKNSTLLCVRSASRARFYA